jgi:hypothetical protein
MYVLQLFDLGDSAALSGGAKGQGNGGAVRRPR